MTASLLVVKVVTTNECCEVGGREIIVTCEPSLVTEDLLRSGEAGRGT